MTKTYEQKAKKHLEKAERAIDGIAPTAFRQSLDCCVVFANSIMRNFNKEKFETNTVYAERWMRLRDSLSDFLTYNKIPK